MVPKKSVALTHNVRADSAQQRKELLRWYKRVRRDLPWRETQDPYRIMVSEIMLQQTQVDRVLDYYQRWLEAYPNEEACAKSTEEAVQRLWKGLGYPVRAKRIRLSCQEIVRRGEWPKTVVGLQELPGIGPYTSAAIACFAFGQAVPLVDTNVARVYARRDNLPLPLDKKYIWQHAENELAKRSPVAYNNALMELGALVCTARKTNCEECPWQASCQTRNNTEYLTQSGNPLKVASKKTEYGVKITDRSKPRMHIVLGLIHHEGKYLITRRPQKAHCGGFWELPGGKREKGEDDRIALAREIEEELGVEMLSARPFVSWNHEYEDRYLSFHCYRCHVFHPEQAQPLAAEDLLWVTPRQFIQYEFPPANGPVLERFRAYHKRVLSTCD